MNDLRVVSTDVASNAMMIDLPIQANDNPRYIENVVRILRDRIDKWKPPDIYVTRIDNWFDDKWVGFAGTIMHELSIWKGNVTVPPFHPNRVDSCELYKCEEGEYKKQLIRDPLHIFQASTSNLKRKITDFSDNGLFIWFSGNTVTNGKGSFMGYFVADNECFTFYLTLALHKGWKAEKVIGLTTHEVEKILQTES
jgi:hypothetical protein